MIQRLISILFIAPICACVLANDEASATTVSDSISMEYNLDEVSVTATKTQAAVIPAQHLKGAQLEVLATHSVADALRYFSGAQVKDFGGVGGIKTVDIRSMGTHHLGVFYDGIEIGNAQNGTVDLGKFSMDNIEELTLYNGQKSEIFQAAKDFGSAGTLYIKTRRPKFAPGKNYNIEVSMKAGTFGLANPSLLYEQKLTDEIHLSANAEYTYATGRYHFRIHKLNADKSVAWDTVGIRQNGDIQAVRAEVGLFGYLTDGKWHVKGYFYNSEKGIPRAIVRNVWTSEQRQWDRNAFVQGNFTKTLFKGYDFQVSAKYSNDYMRYLNPDTTLMYIDNEFWQQELYLTIANKYQIFDWWDVALSGDYQLNWLDATLANFANPRRHTGLLAAATAFQYKWIRAQASVLGTFIKDERRNSEHRVQSSTPTSNNWTPAVFVSYQPILYEQLFLRAFYKHIFRMPTFNDLYYTDMGNIALEPEYTTQYDGGVEYTKNWDSGTFRAFNIKADGYFNQIKNKIVAVPKGNSQYRWMMMNLGYVEIRGLDVSVGTTIRIPGDVFLGVNANYTFQKAQDFTDKTDTLTYGGQISYIPKHSGAVTANLSWHGWGLNYSFIYVGERYHNSANIPANYELPWWTNDLSLNKTFAFDKWKLATTIEVNNFLNQQYDVVLNYPMPGINGKLILKAMF